jgi:uncharacterized protein (DUF885 family)
MLLQAGLLDKRPRSRELFYIFQLQRAARVPAELRMHSGEWDLERAIASWMADVPLMERNLAYVELHLYLRNPMMGLNYTIGMIQLERLLADRARQLGGKFDLAKFHDEFLAAGLIPISLTRWEMTGLDDEVKPLWEEAMRERRTVGR